MMEVTSMSLTTIINPPTITGWRLDAAQIVEGLFPVTDPAGWNLLIDLRQALLHGKNWSQTLDQFLTCRCRFESDHYLPFYRLRRLLSASLKLEAELDAPVEVAALADLLRTPHVSLDSIKKAVRRELFEHRLHLDPASKVPLRVVERI